MKITFLGTGSGLSTIGKNHSALLLETSQKSFLIDCGEPVSRTLAELEMNPDIPEAIIITHFHPDHASGIYMLLQRMHILKRKKLLEVFLPENIELFRRSLELFYIYPEKLSFEIVLKDIKEISTNNNYLEAAENDHLARYKDRAGQERGKAYSLLIKGDNNLLYSSDIGRISSVKSLLDDAEVVIIDALHPELNELEELAKSRRTIYLTHEPREDFLKMVYTNQWENVIVADEYQKIIF